MRIKMFPYCIRVYRFVFWILSVWYARSENILVYPTGLIATVITVYLLFIAGYLGI
jgi:nicotinamide mononucleotide transporter